MGLARRVRALTERLRGTENKDGVAADPGGRTDVAVAAYWSSHNVTSHHHFTSAEESLEYFHWRNDQYYPYIALMPVTGQDGKVVLNYGCGPGHDLVGFGVYSKPKRLIGIDVSATSLEQARRRLSLHGIDHELILHAPTAVRLPLEDCSVHYVHSSGVLHYTTDPDSILREFHRVLHPNGVVRVMVYNYDSLWVHLYVAYQKMIVENAFPGLGIREAFSKTTDGPGCPISRVYKPSEFIALADAAGFTATFVGAAVSMHEASLIPKRFDAIMDRRLPSESRKFLSELYFDQRGFAMHNGHLAGVDGCYLLQHRS